MKKSVPVFFLAANLLIHFPGFAQEAPSVEEMLRAEDAAPPRPPTALISRWTRDNNDNEIYAVLVNQPLAQNWSGSFRAVHVDLNSGNDRLRFEGGGVGGTWQPSRFGVSFSFDIWGDITILRNRDFNGALIFQGDKWDWDIRLQHRIIDSKVELTLPDGREFSDSNQTYSDSWGATVYYKPTPSWSFYAGGNDYDYENSLDAVNQAFALSLLTIQSVVLAAQYTEWNAHFGTDYRFGPRQLGFRYAVDQPIFRVLKARTYTASFSFPINQRFRLNFQGGVRHNLDSIVDDTKFATVSLITLF